MKITEGKKNLTGKGKFIKQVRRLKDKIIHSKTAYIHNKYSGNTEKKMYNMTSKTVNMERNGQ